MSANVRPYSTRMESEVVEVQRDGDGRTVTGGIDILYPGESALFEVEFDDDGETARVTTIIQPTPGIAAALRRAEYRLRHPRQFIRKGRKP